MQKSFLTNFWADGLINGSKSRLPLRFLWVLVRQVLRVAIDLRLGDLALNRGAGLLSRADEPTHDGSRVGEARRPPPKKGQQKGQSRNIVILS